MNALEYFETRYRELNHGNSTYINHCFGVYTILNNMGCSNDVCMAGLYHSVYGTDSFDTTITLSKQTVIELIGVRAEKLVSIFCNIRNRTECLLNNTLSLEDSIRYDLLCIELANLQEQLGRMDNNQELEQICVQIQNELYLAKNFKKTFEHCTINDKSLYVFDNILDNSTIEWINSFCLNSKYTPDHRSNQLNYDLDSRFACDLTDADLESTKIFPTLKKIVQSTGLNLVVKNSYINHYTIATSTSRHVDSSEPDTYTILVFCNKFWESTWGGELAFYDDCKQSHTMIDYKPSRVVLFDSRIQHKVMPLTLSAKKDRYTIAIKCFIQKDTTNV